MNTIVSRAAKHYGAVVVIAALLVNIAVLTALGLAVPLESDTVFFAAIAKNFASGNGYSNPRSPWPDDPALDRLPGWTGSLALAFSILPNVNPPIVVRVTTLLLNLAAALLMARLAFKVTQNRTAALFAGLFYVVYLPALFFMHSGLSETGLIVVLTAVALLFLNGRVLWGALLLGFSCLFRANFILLTPLVPAFLWWLGGRSRALAVGGLALFAIFPGLWMARNALNGCPMLSTTSGEVLRGTHNPVVFYDWSHLGLWIQPDDIPGEEPFQSLAKRMNQCDLCRHYQAEAKKYAVENWTRLPLVMAGRFYRGYVPIPGNVTGTSVLGFGMRGIILIGFVLLWKRWRTLIDHRYQVMLAGFILISLATSLLVTAAARHTFWLEVLLTPCVAAAAATFFTKAAVPECR